MAYDFSSLSNFGLGNLNMGTGIGGYTGSNLSGDWLGQGTSLGGNFGLGAIGNSADIGNNALGILNTNPTASSGFGASLGGLGGILGGLSSLGNLALGGLQAFTGLQNVRLGQQALKNAQQQFKFEKAYANRNLANQAKTINNQYNNAAEVAAGMIGSGSYNPATDSKGSYGLTDPKIVQQYRDRAKNQHVDGSPIK